MTRTSAASIVLVVVAFAGPGVGAYLKLGTEVADGRLVALRWTRQPIRYYVTNRDVVGVSAPELQAAINRAFGTWAGVPNTSIRFEFVGFTNAEPSNDGDRLSVIGFQSRPGPEFERTLGATQWEVDTMTGELLASDIFLNSVFDWSVAPGGAAARYDVESIVVHEIGHLLGLGHSALGETELQSSGRRRVLGKRAVMFPIAYPAGNIEDRTLEADDIAGATDSYGSGGATQATGSIAGRVTLNGSGLFGAHVTVLDTATGILTSGFALSAQGEFVIGSLAPGLYVVRVEPLDDGDKNSFFSEDTDVNINFKATYYARLVEVPAGGASGSIEIKVQPK
jgi:hypothetical protein